MNAKDLFLGLLLLFTYGATASTDAFELDKDNHLSYAQYHVSAFDQGRFMEIISDTYDREYFLINQLIKAVTAAQNSHFEDDKISYFEEDFQYKLTVLEELAARTVWKGIPLFQSPNPSFHSSGRSFYFTFYGVEDKVVIHLPSLDLAALSLDKATVLTPLAAAKTLKKLDAVYSCLDKCKREESKALDDFYNLGEKKYVWDQALRKKSKVQRLKDKFSQFFFSK